MASTNTHGSSIDRYEILESVKDAVRSYVGRHQPSDLKDDDVSTLLAELSQRLGTFATQGYVERAFLVPLVEEPYLQPINVEFLDMIVRLLREIDQFLARQMSIVPEGIMEMAVDSFTSARHRFTASMESGIDWGDELGNAIDRMTSWLFDLIQRHRSREAADLVRQLELSRLLALGAASEATDAADSAKSSAGIAADSDMAAHFQTLGEGQQTSANDFRKWTLISMLAGSALAAIFLFTHSLGMGGGETQATEYVSLGQKVLLVAGAFAIAAYLGRQAHNHRTQSNWALSLAAQLKTFDAYCKPIDNQATKDELRQKFASRVFGDQPAISGETAPSNSGDLAQKSLDLVAKMLPGDK
ncbi:hypothetical protein [Arthrobacter psychrochitiniphilus]|uniref:hypothetical protein n=1 Tax=Arthrobacter psychrochitiniphilus TaxID=291045 RepID=UPI003F7C7034